MKPHEETWTQGQLLLTERTRRYPPEERERMDAQEKRRLFANFSAADEGRGRRFVAEFESEADLKLAAQAPAMARLLLELQAACCMDAECLADPDAFRTQVKATLRAAGVLP